MSKPTLTVAIPTMDRWDKFLKKQLPIYLDHPLIDCVLISDENGNDIDKICQEGYDKNPKLRLYQNEFILGVYGNKRQCLLNAPTQYVAVLDSDNWFEPSYFDSLMECIKRDGDLAEKTIYTAGENERLFIDTGVKENRIKHFSGKRINKENWNTILKIVGWNFLLNDGNAVWPKSFVQHMPDLPEERVVGTDSLLAMRYAIQAGYTMSVEHSLHYIHTVHDGSHWTQNAGVSSRLMGQMDWRV
jgi:glycosyltransferase involved in cell wall biosynthesis